MNLEEEPNYHPKLYLLGIERTGWRRWIFGRWVYASEPFRRDIQRKNKEIRVPLKKGERISVEGD